MPIKKILLTLLLFLVCSISYGEENLKSIGKFKDWESFTLAQNGNKVCFAQSIPVVRAPKKLKREPSRLFVSFRPGENVTNEISITAGYDFNKKNIVTVVSGKNKYKFDLMQDRFAWMTSKKLEKKMIRTMKKGSRIMVTGHNQNGSQTKDHYSLLGFTKAYNASKANCS